MLQAVLPHYPIDECKELYNKINRALPDRIICAGGESHIDSCPGDSGSTLQYVGKVPNQLGARMVQYGLVSFGFNGCGIAFEKPGVNTDVSKYIDWILESMEP